MLVEIARETDIEMAVVPASGETADDGRLLVDT